MSANVLIVDDAPIFRQLLGAALHAAGYDTLTAGDGIEALEQLKAHEVALVLLDMAMPRMDGLAFLGKIRAEARYRSLPVVLLTAVGERDYILHAAGFGVQDYLLKSAFSLPELIARVAKHVPKSPRRQGEEAAPKGAAAADAAGTAAGVSQGQGDRRGELRSAPAAGRPVAAKAKERCPELLTREQTLERVEQATDGKAIAGVVGQVIAIAASPRSEMSELVKTLESDPILASRVLQAANSAAFMTGKTRITTIEEATRNIGFKSVHNLVLSIGMFNAFPPDAADGFNTLRCWQHCFAVASLLDLLVKETAEMTQGIIHLVGLCHDLGEILLRQHFAAEYRMIVEFAGRTQMPLEQVRATALGMRHPELVSLILTRLELPAAILGPIEEYFAGSGPAALKSPRLVVRALYTANALAHGLQLCSSAHASVAPFMRSELRSVVGEAVPRIDAESFRNHIVTTTNLLARLGTADEGRMVKPLIRRSTRRVWYVRHKALGELDPVAVALGLMCRCTVSDRLPGNAEEWKGVDGLVAVSPRVDMAPMSFAELQAGRVAAGRAALPVLCLGGQVKAGPEGMQVREYPLELADLGAFVAGLEGGSAVQAA